MDSYNANDNFMDRYLYKLGKSLLHMPLISTVIYKINAIYLIILPRKEYYCLVKSVKLFLALIFGWISVLFFQWRVGADSAINVAITICVLWFLSFGIINRLFCKKQYRLLELFDEYLANVRHCFHVNNGIEDTIFDSLEECDELLRLHINQIYELLVSRDTDIVEQYKDIAPNKYFLTFMGLCNTVMIYGDVHRGDKSVFLENIGYLRDEIRIEMLKERRINHSFSGLSVMTILPVFSLPFIEKWGISNLPELSTYYNGLFGMVASIIITILSIMAFSMISFLKNPYRYISKEHPYIDGILNEPRIYYLVEWIRERYPRKMKRIKMILDKSGDNISTRQFIVKQGVVFIVSFFCILLLTIYGVQLQRIDNVDAGFRWYYLVMIICLSCLFCKIPLMIIRVKCLLMTMNYEDEVMQFHSIIIMLVYIKRMSSEIILEWLENFADVFKKSISECNARFSMDSEVALEILKGEESYGPFVRIVENLKDCDRVGPGLAFEEICSQRQYFIEKRKQDNEINISNKATIGKVVGYIPLLVTVFLYLIYPFVAESINQLLSYVNEINSL